MSNKKVLDKNVEILELNSRLLKCLKDNNINKVIDLWEKTRNDLKEINLSQEDMREVSVKLQLHGLDLNKKVY